MRRRRQVLQVSTFPFLAVLLCAMGSLILLLLVIDRRAKAVSRAKLEQAAARAVSDDAKMAAAQQAARQAELEERRRKLHDLLAREEEEVVRKIKTVQGSSTAVTADIQAQEALFNDLRQRLDAEAGQLVRKQEEVTARQASIAIAGEKVEASKQELVRLAGELARLEQTLRDLRALRERDKQTYSLVPYIGRHGSNRRPIYVECTAAGLIFHPDRMMLEGPGLLPVRIRDEVERRIARQRETLPVSAQAGAGKTDQSPYLLMLVRPDGIASYYRSQGALVGLKIDFGYEFVEADWILDFSADDDTTAQQPWMTAGNSRSPPTGSTLDSAGPSRSMPAGIGHGGAFFGPGQVAPEGTGQGAPAAGGSGPEGYAGVSGFGQSSRHSPSADVGARSGPVTQPGPERPPAGGSGSAPGGGVSRSVDPSSGPASLGATLLRPLQGTAPSGSATGSDGAGVTETGGSGDRADGLPYASPRGLGPRGSTGAGSPWARRGPSGVGYGGSASDTGGAASVQASGGGGASAAGPALGPPTAEPGTTGASPGGDDDRRLTPGNLASRTGGVPMSPTAATGNAEVSRGSGDGSVPPGSQPAAPGNASAGVGKAANPTGSGSGVPGKGASNGASVNNTGEAGNPSAAANPAVGGSQRTNKEDGDGEPGIPSAPYLPANTPATGQTRPTRPPPLPLSRLLGNRDWPILVECQADAVVVRALGLRVGLAALEGGDQEQGRLGLAVQKLIADRQATVRPGEPPYRPLIRYQVYPGGLRAYYLAYPQLENLRLPMTRENVVPPPRAPLTTDR